MLIRAAPCVEGDERAEMLREFEDLCVLARDLNFEGGSSGITSTMGGRGLRSMESGNVLFRKTECSAGKGAADLTAAYSADDPVFRNGRMNADDCSDMESEFWMLYPAERDRRSRL